MILPYCDLGPVAETCVLSGAMADLCGEVWYNSENIRLLLKNVYGIYNFDFVNLIVIWYF